MVAIVSREFFEAFRKMKTSRSHVIAMIISTRITIRCLDRSIVNDDFGRAY